MSLKSSLDAILSTHYDGSGPGVQVALVSSDGLLYEGAVGLANPVLDPNEEVTTTHEANLYSVSKFFTACCVLKLIDMGKIRPMDKVQGFLPDELSDLLNDCTVEQLVAHEGGAPNPLPLKWVHTPDEMIDETKILTKVLVEHPFKPMPLNGRALPYHYSNVGYWVLGHVVTSACGEPPSSFALCCRNLLFSSDIPMSKEEGETIVSDRFNSLAKLAYGHVPRWSALALAARLFCPHSLIGPTNSSWMRMEPHYIDGVGYGGLIGSSRSVSAYLTLLLKGKILSPASTDRLFRHINQTMTFGMHVRPRRGLRVYHKEGGGAGCHSSIQIRPQQRLAGCVIAGDASFDVNTLLDEMMDCAQGCSDADKAKLISQTKVVAAKDGTRLHTKMYEKKSKGSPAILLLHGGPGVPDYLEDLAVLMVNSDIAGSAITFDQRGVGQSKLPPGEGGITIDLLLDDIDAIRLAYDLDKIHVAGHSWGGLLAQLYSQRNPEYVASLVLLSPTTVSRASDWSKMENAVMNHNRRKGGLINFAKMGLWSLLLYVPFVSDYAARSMFGHVMKNYYYDPKSAPNPSPRFLAGVSARAMVQSKRAFLEHAKDPITMRCDMFPSLCLFGEEDIYGGEMMNEFCSRFKGQSVLIAQSSHLSWVDQPIKLVSLLGAFYSEA